MITRKKKVVLAWHVDLNSPFHLSGDFNSLIAKTKFGIIVA
jgi:hypothetical protein